MKKKLKKNSCLSSIAQLVIDREKKRTKAWDDDFCVFKIQMFSLCYSFSCCCGCKHVIC